MLKQQRPSYVFVHLSDSERNTKNKNLRSPRQGNWTPVSRVTGGDTNNYTNEEVRFKKINKKIDSKNLTLSCRLTQCIYGRALHGKVSHLPWNKETRVLKFWSNIALLIMSLFTYLIPNATQKIKIWDLPIGELNPGLPRDRRGY